MTELLDAKKVDDHVKSILEQGLTKTQREIAEHCEMNVYDFNNLLHRIRHGNRIKVRMLGMLVRGFSSLLGEKINRDDLLQKGRTTNDPEKAIQSHRN